MEVFKDVVGYEGLYQVSNEGRVKSLDYRRTGEESILKGRPNRKDGYLRVNFCKDGIKKDFYIHRLTALAFLPNSENKSEVNHKNGIKADNHLENLEFTTPKENMQHAYDTGLQHKGEKHPNSKLTEKVVLQIRDLAKCKRFTHREIATIYNCSRQRIGAIANNETWRHV
jgi:predicted XRE-type DNA-binding protein